MSSNPRIVAAACDAPSNSLKVSVASSRQGGSERAEKRSSQDPRDASSSERAATKPPIRPVHKKLRPAKRTAQARANHKAGAISCEQAPIYLGVGCSTLEKLAACRKGPFVNRRRIFAPDRRAIETSSVAGGVRVEGRSCGA
jgi:hypothetical protein